ncbi:MAG: hypothetical protein ACE15C_14960 [Phycisphaerae bacterium]
MVQEVFNEHKLSREFAAKVIEGVPPMAGSKGKKCSFAWALESAMAVTKHPFKYSDIMGYSGLAFRVRWYNGPKFGVCPSCAVGEMAEVEKALGSAG